MKPGESWWSEMDHHRVSAASREIPRAIEQRDLAPLGDHLAIQLAVLFAVEQHEVLKEIVRLYDEQHNEYASQRSAIVAERRLADAKIWDDLFSIVDQALCEAEALLPTDALQKAYRATLGITSKYPKYFENLQGEVERAILRSRKVPGLPK